MTGLEFAGALLLAVTLGCAIGLERQWRQCMAGLRTNALVCTGAAMFSVLGAMTPDEASPTRLASQVVTGVGFLGGGVILREGLNVRGLNTAATLWCSAAVGVLVGAGHWALAATGAAGILATNLLLRPVAHALEQRPSTAEATRSTCYHVTIVCRTEDETDVRGLLLHLVSREAVTLRTLRSEGLDDPRRRRVRVELMAPARSEVMVERLTMRLGVQPGVSTLTWEVTPPSRHRAEVDVAM